MSKLASAEPAKQLDNRPVLFMLVLVLAAMVLLGWYAFYSVPPTTVAVKDDATLKTTPKKPAKVAPPPKLGD